MSESAEPSQPDEDGPATPTPAAGERPPAREIGLPRQSRKLSDRLLMAFHQACDQDQIDVARQLLGIYEYMVTRRDPPPDSGRRRALEALVAAHERLWNLRHGG
jgi:hypothetical protein